MKKIFSIIPALFLIGCQPNWTIPKQNGSLIPARTVSVCVDLPANQHQITQQAISIWDKALQQEIRLVMITNHKSQQDCGYWIHEVDYPNPEDDKALAWTSMIGGREVSMRKGYYEDNTLGILLHELGHAFGASHVEGTLMSPNYQKHRFTCPDIGTVAQVAAWNKFRLEKLSACYY